MYWVNQPFVGSQDPSYSSFWWGVLGSKDLNSGPQACVAGTLPPGPSPQPVHYSSYSLLLLLLPPFLLLPHVLMEYMGVRGQLRGVSCLLPPRETHISNLDRQAS